MWTLNQVDVIPVVVGALGTVSKRLEGFLEEIGTVIPVEMLQKNSITWNSKNHMKGYGHEGYITLGPYRPFRLTRATARTRVGTRAN